MTKRLSKTTKNPQFLIERLEFWNYKGRLRFPTSKLIYFGCATNAPLQIRKCTQGWEPLN